MACRVIPPGPDEESDLEECSPCGKLPPWASPRAEEDIFWSPVADPRKLRFDDLREQPGARPLRHRVLATLGGVLLISVLFVFTALNSREEEGRRLGAGASLRQAGDRLQHAVHFMEAGVEIEPLFLGNFSTEQVSREALFGTLDDRELCALFKDSEKFMLDLLLFFEHLPGVTNIFITKVDSRFNIEDKKLDLMLRFTGWLQGASYRVVAFGGKGYLDRTGLPGGFKNWGFRGIFDQVDKVVNFYTDYKQAFCNPQDPNSNCGSLADQVGPMWESGGGSDPSLGNK